MNEHISFPTEKQIVINDRTVRVKKMGLIKYAQIVKEFDGLIGSVLRIFRMDQEINEFEVRQEKELTTQERAAEQSKIICQLISSNIEQIVSFLCVAVPELDRKYIEENVGIDDTLQLIEAIIEVNGLNKALDNVKKFISLLSGGK